MFVSIIWIALPLKPASHEMKNKNIHIHFIPQMLHKFKKNWSNSYQEVKKYNEWHTIEN
jgi:hypothetical protein